MADLLILAPADWVPRARAHARRVDGWVQPHLVRRRAGQTHPVEDFLFDYYRLSPAKLRRWNPGPGVVLSGEQAEARLESPDFCAVSGGVATDPARLARHAGRLRDAQRLLAATASRPPSYGCFGLHEWAMVYRLPADDLRHSGLALRLGPAGTDAVVAAGPAKCTHFDAFRFFTEAARPRNETQPTRAAQVAMEQPGCLHAGMDLYRWAAAFDPFLSSDLVADCFAHAREIRAVDMRASPYDLADLGFAPIAIETAEGRAEYVRHQRAFAESGAVLRLRLLTGLGQLAELASDWLSQPGARGRT